MDRESTVQQWIETLPPSNTSSVPASSVYRAQTSQNPRKLLARDISLQSDDASSHCSSVESVLELRRPDPEAVLLGLGFGPTKSSSTASRIPIRFLQPSKLLTQIDINKFIEQYGSAKYPDQSSPPPSPARTQSKT